MALFAISKSPVNTALTLLARQFDNYSHFQTSDLNNLYIGSVCEEPMAEDSKTEQLSVKCKTSKTPKNLKLTHHLFRSKGLFQMRSETS